jgi:hypothetical protein
VVTISSRRTFLCSASLLMIPGQVTIVFPVDILAATSVSLLDKLASSMNYGRRAGYMLSNRAMTRSYDECPVQRFYCPRSLFPS